MLKKIIAVLIASVSLAGCNAGSNEPADRQPHPVKRPISDVGREGSASDDQAGSAEAGDTAHPLGYDTPVYDFEKEFSADKNPSGPWTIGSFNHTFTRKADELQNLTTYGELKFTKTESSHGGMGFYLWGSVSFGFLGSSPSATGVVKNTRSSTVYSIPAGTIGVFPQKGPCVVRWLAPEDGKVDVRATFDNLTTTDGWPEVWVLHNQDVSSPLHYEKAYKGTGTNHILGENWKSGTKSQYDDTISVIAKDTIDFVVDPMYTVSPGHTEQPDGNATDIIGLSAIITYVNDDGGVTD